MLREIGYVGKLADDIDRAKMKILISQLLSKNVFTKENEGEAQALGLRGARFGKLDLEKIGEIIEEINESDAGIFGLHPAIKPVSEYSHSIVSKLAAIYSQHSQDSPDRLQTYLKPI